jgi:hypothetical protein
MLRFALLAAMVVAMSSGPYARADQEVYAKADEIIGRAEEAVASNLAAFIKANEAPLQTARSELATLIKEMNETGKQSLATSLQTRLNKLDETIQKRVSAKVPIVEPPQKPLLERLAGKWDRSLHEGYLLVNANGSIALHRDIDNSVVVRGRCSTKAPDVIEVAWQDGSRWELRMAGDDTIAVYEWSADGSRYGDGYALERIR